MTASAQERGASGAVDPRVRRSTYALISVLLTLPIVWHFYWPVGHGLDVTGHQIGRDFIGVWAGPQLAFSGAMQTLFDLPGYHAAIGKLFGQPLPFHNWGYPLFTLVAFWPLAQLPYFWALAVWTAGLFAAFAGITLAPLDRQQRAPALLVLIAAPACLINIVGGQNGFLSAALFLGGILWIERRPVVSGILFGLLTFKPHLGILLPFVLVALGAWRVIASAVVTAALLVATSVLVFGVEAWLRYFEVVGPFQVMLLQRFEGFYTYMMASVLAGARTFGIPYSAALALQVAVAVPVVAATVWAVRKTADPCRRAFVLATAAPLVTPYAFDYDLTAVAAVLVWLLFGRLPWRPAWSGVYLLAWVAPIAMMYLNMQGLGLFPLVLIALFALAVREAAHLEAALGKGEKPLPSPT